MGMFDWVAFEMSCPKCLETVRGFQSKDGDCQLEVVMPHTVDHFYSRCDACATEIRFEWGKMTAPTYTNGYERFPYPPDGKAKDYTQ